MSDDDKQMLKVGDLFWYGEANKEPYLCEVISAKYDPDDDPFYYDIVSRPLSEIESRQASFTGIYLRDEFDDSHRRN